MGHILIRTITGEKSTNRFLSKQLTPLNATIAIVFTHKRIELSILHVRHNALINRPVISIVRTGDDDGDDDDGYFYSAWFH